MLHNVFTSLADALNSVMGQRLTPNGVALFDALTRFGGEEITRSLSISEVNKIADEYSFKAFNSTVKENASLREELNALRASMDHAEGERVRLEKDYSCLQDKLSSLKEDYHRARARERLYATERAILEEELRTAKSAANRYRMFAVTDFLPRPCGMPSISTSEEKKSVPEERMKVGEMKVEVKADTHPLRRHMNRAIDKLERTIHTNRPNMSQDKFIASTNSLNSLRDMFQ